MKTAATRPTLASGSRQGLGAETMQPMGKGALTPGGRDCGHGAPLGPPVGRASSNHPTGQTVTESEIISSIYGVYSIHCGDLMGKVVKTG